MCRPLSYPFCVFTKIAIFVKKPGMLLRSVVWRDRHLLGKDTRSYVISKSQALLITCQVYFSFYLPDDYWALVSKYFFIHLIALSNKLHLGCLCFCVLCLEHHLTLQHPLVGQGCPFTLLILGFRAAPDYTNRSCPLPITASCFSNGQLAILLSTLTFHLLCSIVLTFSLVGYWQ
jgi:hypothetical protein